MAFLIAQLVMNCLQYRRPWFDSWVGKLHWRRVRLTVPVFLGFPCGLAGKEYTCNAGDLGLIPGLGRSPGEGKGYPLQYSRLENSMDYTAHVVTMSRTLIQILKFTMNTFCQLTYFQTIHILCFKIYYHKAIFKQVLKIEMYSCGHLFNNYLFVHSFFQCFSLFFFPFINLCRVLSMLIVFLLHWVVTLLSLFFFLVSFLGIHFSYQSFPTFLSFTLLFF